MKRTLFATAASLLFTAAALAQTQSTPEQLLVGARNDALQVLLAAARGDDPYLRANAIEAMQYAKERALPLAELGLRDEHPAVRFASLVMLGRMKQPGQAAVAEQMTNDTDPSVRAAAYFAANQSGSNIDVTPMASLLLSRNPNVRANTAMLLGMMGNTTSLPLLEQASKTPMPTAPQVTQLLVRVQIAEAQTRLGEFTAIDPIRAGAFSEFPEVRMLSVGVLGRLGDVQNMEDALLTVFRKQDEVLELRLAAAAALAEHGRAVVIKEVLDDLSTILGATRSGEPAFRAQAATTLGMIERARTRVRPTLIPNDPPAIVQQFQSTTATEALIAMLSDTHPRVRVAAAAGVLNAMQP